MRLIERFEEALLSTNRVQAREILLEAMRHQSEFETIEGLFVPVFEHIGAGWERGEIALSQIYMSGRICEELVDELLPAAGQPHRADQPIIALAVLDDYHQLGKRLVYSILRAVGYRVLDYGRVTVDEVVAHCLRDRVEILLLSILMLPAALHIKDLKAALAQNDLHPKIVVGGAPFRMDRRLWREVGADAMGNSASDVIGILESLTGGRA